MPDMTRVDVGGKSVPLPTLISRAAAEVYTLLAGLPWYDGMKACPEDEVIYVYTRRPVAQLFATAGGFEVVFVETEPVAPRAAA